MYRRSLGGHRNPLVNLGVLALLGFVSNQATACKAFAFVFRPIRRERMLRRLQNGIEAYRRAWADAKGLIDRHGDMGQREAILRAQDPRGSDGSVAHWRRVASIIAWRTGQDSIVSAQR